MIARDALIQEARKFADAVSCDKWAQGVNSKYCWHCGHQRIGHLIRDLLTLIDQGWQPMASAPEAEYILLFVPNYGTVRAIGSRSPHMPTVIEWWAPQMDGGHGAMVYNPSHWQPLPAPPIGGSGQIQEAREVR